MWLSLYTSNNPSWSVTELFILITWQEMLHADLALRNLHLTYISQPALSGTVYTSQIWKGGKCLSSRWNVVRADLPMMLYRCDIAFSMLHAPGQLQTASTPSLHCVSAQQAFIPSDIPSPRVEKHWSQEPLEGRLPPSLAASVSACLCLLRNSSKDQIFFQKSDHGRYANMGGLFICKLVPNTIWCGKLLSERESETNKWANSNRMKNGVHWFCVGG